MSPKNSPSNHQSTPPTPARGLALFSGGLDSMLAVCILREQGCHVEGVVFNSPFFDIRAAHTGAAQMSLRLHVIDFTEDIAALVKHPPHGFGKAMNPCIDCHALMIQRTGKRMRELGWDFIATGEVLNQRPMSQNRRALTKVATLSGFGDDLIRPLSAKLLAPSSPELDGRVDRSRLLNLSGRSRKPQHALAQKYGLHEYPSSAGGCLLTERYFCRKLQDLKDHEGLGEARNLQLLRLGRHFRLPGGAKCIVGRNGEENKLLAKQHQPDETLIRPLSTPGPTVIVSAQASAEDLERATALAAGYCDASAHPVRLRYIDENGTREMSVSPMPRASALKWQL